MLDWLIASYLFGVITGFFVTAVFWVRAIERIIRQNKMVVHQLLEEIENEKADKQSV